jgi:hypothetical protein
MITVDHGGRLGNNMFQYAIARSVAEKNGYNFYINPHVWIGGTLFDCPLGVSDGAIKRSIKELDDKRFNPDVFNIEDYTHLEGFWQCEQYFEREDVKIWFKPKYKQSVWNFQEIYPIGDYCYVNVRGTDQHIPHLTLPKKYYDEAMEIILGFNSKLKFVVITDDIALAQEYFPSFPVFSNDRDTDFCLFHSARFVIGSISTFVWWSTYLNDYNIVIMPKRFYHYNLPYMGWGSIGLRTHKFIWI